MLMQRGGVSAEQCAGGLRDVAGLLCFAPDCAALRLGASAGRREVAAPHSSFEFSFSSMKRSGVIRTSRGF